MDATIGIPLRSHGVNVAAIISSIIRRHYHLVCCRSREASKSALIFIVTLSGHSPAAMGVFRLLSIFLLRDWCSTVSVEDWITLTHSSLRIVVDAVWMRWMGTMRYHRRLNDSDAP